MAYIEALVPRDWNFCTLFGYPYAEGIRNIGVAFSCCSFKTHPPPSLCGRVIHLVLGIALLIPLLNTLIFIVLRALQMPLIIEDCVRTFSPSTIPESTAKQIDNYSAERDADIEVYNAGCPDAGRLAQVVLTENKAANLVQHKDALLVEQHLQASLCYNSDICSLDNVITHAIGKDLPVISVEGNDLTPSARFSQLGGLTQMQAGNFMCGYYALFYMLNAASGREGNHTNRSAFNKYLVECQKMIATKRTACWLHTHRNQPIPHGLEIPSNALSPDDMQYLIQCSDSLAVLREIPGCLMLEMDAYDSPPCLTGVEPVVLLGKSKTDYGTTQCYPDGFPLFIIVKENDLHSYLFYAYTPGEFFVVHSLNYSINNPNFFQPATFAKIIQALTGIKTPLRIRW
jgi:hypothetical protein